MIQDNTTISKDEFIQAVKFIFNSIFFQFNNTIYKQIFDTSMGSPLSPIVADIVLQDLEIKVLECLFLKIPIYYRYVDDILFVAPVDHFNHILKTLNHSMNDYSFRKSNDDSFNFLDIKIIIVKIIIVDP